jgi:hypothetical protein
MAVSKSIPSQRRREAQSIIERFNRETLGGGVVRYTARFKGLYLYLDRIDFLGAELAPICRLKFTGETMDWQIAIYKYSRDIYDPDETWFPGHEKFDGTIESALSAGLAAYPPDYSPGL